MDGRNRQTGKQWAQMSRFESAAVHHLPGFKLLESPAAGCFSRRPVCFCIDREHAIPLAGHDDTTLKKGITARSVGSRLPIAAVCTSYGDRARVLHAAGFRHLAIRFQGGGPATPIRQVAESPAGTQPRRACPRRVCGRPEIRVWIDARASVPSCWDLSLGWTGRGLGSEIHQCSGVSSTSRPSSASSCAWR